MAGEIKEVELMPSSLETVDGALYEYINEKLNIYATTNKGWKKVPVIWVSAERAFQIKNDKDLRDSKGVLKLPIMTIERTSVTKSSDRKGSIYANIPVASTPAGGTITIAQRIKQDKTANFARAMAKRKKGQINFPRKNDKVVYETITIPLPTYIDVEYEIVIETEYQQQMNDIIAPFITRTGQINYFHVRKDGHMYEGFVDEGFSLDNNAASLDEDARSYKTTIPIKVLGYVMGDGDNANRPKIVKRENAVEFRITRERVMLEDEHELADTIFDAFYRE